MLVVSSGFGSINEERDFYRPWFDLVDAEKLDVSYIESLGGLEYQATRSPEGRRVEPPGLAES